MSAPGKGILGRVAGVATGRVVELVDPDLILEYVDLDLLLERIDVQKLVDRIDPNVLMDRIDIQRLLSRVDLNEVLAGIDLDQLLAGVDLETVVQRSGVPDIIMASTGRFADSAVDLGRRQVVGVDALVDRGVDRLLRRKSDPTRLAPPHLRPDHAESRVSDLGDRTLCRADRARAGCRSRHRRGDGLLRAGIRGDEPAHQHPPEPGPLSPDRAQPLAIAALVVWAFLYVFVALAVAGRTFGKAAVGLRVVRADGLPISARQALIRTLVLPFSFVFLGIGLLMILLQREHRALHDLAAGTAVVTDWADRTTSCPRRSLRSCRARRSAYCRAIAIRSRSSGSMKWSWSSSPMSSWTQWILPVNRLVAGGVVRGDGGAGLVADVGGLVGREDHRLGHLDAAGCPTGSPSWKQGDVAALGQSAAVVGELHPHLVLAGRDRDVGLRRRTRGCRARCRRTWACPSLA